MFNINLQEMKAVFDKFNLKDYLVHLQSNSPELYNSMFRYEKEAKERKKQCKTEMSEIENQISFIESYVVNVVEKQAEIDKLQKEIDINIQPQLDLNHRINKVKNTLQSKPDLIKHFKLK